MLFGNYFTQYFKNDNINSKNLYTVASVLGYIHTYNEKWESTFLYIPRVNSDMKRVDSKDLVHSGVLKISRNLDTNLSLSGGLYFSREFFGNFFVPLGGIDWKINDKMRIFGTIPRDLNFQYEMNDNFMLDLSYRVKIASYRLNKDYNEDYVKIKDRTIKLRANYFLSSKWVLYGEVGYTLWPDYKRYSDKEFRDNTLFDTGFSHRKNALVFGGINNGFVFGGGIALKYLRE
ncbi:MAG: DUF6268 family outer membrane beta-barrel protein [Flavobacteriales bacterium]